MKHFEKIMIVLVLTVFAFGLFVGQRHEEQKHEHVEGRVYFNNLKHVHKTICLKDTTVFTSDGRHHDTRYKIIVERPY